MKRYTIAKKKNCFYFPQAVKQHTIDVNIEALSASVPVPVEDWLPQEMHVCC